MKIGIISDTHGLLRPEVTEAMRECGRILHAGDINKPEILEELRKIAPVTVVRGNNDKEWAEEIPFIEQFEIEGLKFCMAHIKKMIPADSKADIIICGHTHKYREETIDGVLWLNPGSCGRGRFGNREITFAVMRVENGRYTIEKRIIEG